MDLIAVVGRRPTVHPQVTRWCTREEGDRAGTARRDRVDDGIGEFERGARPGKGIAGHHRRRGRWRPRKRPPRLQNRPRSRTRSRSPPPAPSRAPRTRLYATPAAVSFAGSERDQYVRGRERPAQHSRRLHRRTAPTIPASPSTSAASKARAASTCRSTACARISASRATTRKGFTYVDPLAARRHRYSARRRLDRGRCWCARRQRRHAHARRRRHFEARA